MGVCGYQNFDMVWYGMTPMWSDSTINIKITIIINDTQFMDMEIRLAY